MLQPSEKMLGENSESTLPSLKPMNCCFTQVIKRIETFVERVVCKAATFGAVALKPSNVSFYSLSSLLSNVFYSNYGTSLAFNTS